MDVDADSAQYALEIAQPEQALKMPPVPSLSFKKSLRTELREQIIEIKCRIAEQKHETTATKESIKNLEQAQQKYEESFRSTNSNTWGTLASSNSEQLLCQIRRLETNEQLLDIYNNQLVLLENQLVEANEKAEKRAQALTGMQASRLTTEGLDAAYVPIDNKFKLMQDWLHKERVLVLRSPPGSGKSTFATAFTLYLRLHGFKVTYLNASRSKHMPNATRSMDDIWRETLDSQRTFSEEAESVSLDEVQYAIIDESQSWYPSNIDDSAHYTRAEVLQFWADVKSLIKPTLVDQRLRRNDISLTEPITGLCLLCLAGYGESNLGAIATPLSFVDPEDEVTRTRLPLGLNFLRLDRQLSHQLIEKFAAVKSDESKAIKIDSEVCDLIYDETNGHVGAIRTLLHHLVSTNRRLKQDVLKFIRDDIYKTDLSAFRTFISVSQATIQRLSDDDLDILVQGIVAFKKGTHTFHAQASNVVELVKLGILVKITGTGNDDSTTVAFPSPLHFDLLLYNILHRRIDLQQSCHSFERFLRELVLRMNPKTLRDEHPNGLLPLESHWRDAVCGSFKIIKTSIGRGRFQQTFLDLFIDDNLQWAIELILNADETRLQEHVERFYPDGRYHDIPRQQHAILNFTSHIPNPSVLDKYDANVYHLVYNNAYTMITVHRKGQRVENWYLIGDQSRTEY